MRVVQHPEHKLKIPSFLCDFVLKKDVPKPYDVMLSGFKSVLICGKPGSGKTSLLLSLLTDKRVLRKTFDNVIVVMPRASRASLKKNIFDKLDPSKVFDDLQNIQTILGMLKLYSSEKETSLLIVDDMQSYLKDPDISLVINHILSNRRHLRVMSIILLQSYNMLPLKSRKLINTVITFRPSQKEWDNITEETLNIGDDDKRKIFHYAFDENNKDGHGFLLVDDSGKIFSRSNEIIVDDA